MKRMKSCFGCLAIVLASAASQLASAGVFPDKDWQQASPEAQGVNSEKLNEAMSYIQAKAGGPGAAEAIVVRHGYVIWKGSQADVHDYGNPWPLHPFNRANNINGIDGDPDKNGEGKEVHTLQVPAITRLQEAYVRKVIDTLNDLDNVLYEITNETAIFSKDWQYHMVKYIKEYEAGQPDRVRSSEAEMYHWIGHRYSDSDIGLGRDPEPANKAAIKAVIERIDE